MAGKTSIAATAKSLAKNFGKLALDAQRVALMEMVSVYERTAALATKSSKKAGKKARKVKAGAVKAGKKAAKAGKRAKKGR